jgi:uncharacterized protein (UPF0248 family)
MISLLILYKDKNYILVQDPKHNENMKDLTIQEIKCLDNFIKKYVSNILPLHIFYV